VLGIAGWQVLLLGIAAALAWLAHLAAGDMALARHESVSVGAWLLALVFTLLGGVSLAEWRVWLRRGLGLARWEWWLLLALFGGAWFMRGTAVTQFPNTFSGDEGSAGLHAALFLQGKADNLFTIGWFSFPSLYYAVQSVFIDLFGQTIEALRYFAALGGSLAVLATYFLARVLFDRETAVAAAVVMMGSHYHIHMSRIGLNNVWDSFFVALVLMGIWHGWHTGRRLPFVLAGLALGLGQYFYVSVRVLPLLLLLWVVGMWWQHPRQWRQRLPDFVLSGYTAVLTVLPLAIYFSGHWAEFQAPLNRVTIVGDRLASMATTAGSSPFLVVLRQMGQAALGFTHLPLRLLYEPGVPLLLPLAAGLFLAGLAWALLHFDGRVGLLLLPLLSVPILSGFSQDPPASQRFILAMPAVAILVALPVGLVGRWLRQLWPESKVWVGLGTAVLLLWLVLVDITFYFGDLYESYELGGLNTVVATDIALTLQAEDAPLDVYFLGFPRMGYFSLATIPYLAPEVHAIDLIEPVATPPAWPIEKNTWIIFLPERIDELAFVQQAYPNGVYEEERDDQGRFLYAVYRLDP
jgi:4-amino-4-deoxy-L-arabinose transferase-like glycosyltransferase